MSGFSPFHQNAPNVSGGISPLLMGLLAGLASLPAQARQRQEQQGQQQSQQADIAYKQAETKAVQEQSDPNNPDNVYKKLQTQSFQQQIDVGNRTQAQQSWDQVGQMISVQPSWGGSPDLIKKAQSAAKTLGIPTDKLLTPDGKLDPAAFSKPLSAAPQDINGQRVRALINAQSTPEGKRTVGAEYGYSLTEAEANAGVILDAKDQAAMMKAQAAVTREADWSSFNTQRLGIQQQLARATENLDSDKANAIRAQISHNQGLLALGWSRVQVSQQNANARMMAAETAVGQRNQMLGQSMLRNADAAVNDMQRNVDSAETALTQAYANNVDPDIITQYSQNLTQAQQMLETYKTKAGTLQDVMSHNIPQAQNIQGASNSRRVTVTPLGGGQKFVNGQTYTDARGNRATYNNGTWSPAP